MPGVVIGIDPGINGGIAVLTLEGEIVEVCVMPTVKVGTKTEVDPGPLTCYVAGMESRGPIRLAVIEKIAARPGQGVCSMFSFGTGYGMVRGVLAALGVPYELVTPQAWQKAVLSGMAPAKDTKTLSVAYCTRRFPGLSLKMTPRSTKPHDGVADAVALAEYARRLVVGNAGK